MTRNENDDTEALSSFYFDWIYECGQSFMQLKQKEKKKTVPQISVYFIVAQTLSWIHESTDLHWDTWFNGQLQERDKDKVLL